MTRPPELPTTSGHKAGTPLREGFTTGTAATAAALAAADLLLNPGSAASAIHLASAIHPADETSETGETGAAPHLLAPHPHLLAPPPMLAPLPPFSAHGVPAGYLTIPSAQCTRLGSRSAKAAVLKDGGDDPDATHNMLIAATVCLFNSVRPGEIIITAGPGIGRATLPGLPLPVGAAAINPVPRLQIRAALTQLAAKYNYTGAFSVCLSAPEGATRARHTLNARLGIIGGISILGTSGRVKPYSHAAWQEVITQGASLAAAQGLSALGLATGRRSEQLLMAAHPDWPEQAFIQMADFAAAAVRAATQAGFRRLAVGLFIGKLLKIAQGLEYTHAHTAPLDLAATAQWAREAGLGAKDAAAVRECNTAVQALDIILRSPAQEAVLAALCRRAAARLKAWSGPGVTIELRLFDFAGQELYSTKI